MNEINSAWFSNFASEQLFGLFLASTFLVLVAGLLVSICRRQSASARFIIWEMASVGVVASVFILLVAPGFPLQSTIATAENSIDASDARSVVVSIADLNQPTSGFNLPQKQAVAETGAIGFAPFEISKDPNTFSNNVTSAEQRSRLEKAQPPVSHEASLAQTPDQPFLSWIPLMLVVTWLAVSVFLLFRFLRALMACHRMIARSQNCKSTKILAAFESAVDRMGLTNVNPNCLYISTEAVVPFAAGIANPKIVLPTTALNWSTSKTEMVLSHELAHIERRDVFWHWIGKLACCVAWFNPLVWISASRAVAERERACDDHVINAGNLPTDYGASLIEIAAAASGKRIELAGCVSMAGPPLKQRLEWILSKTELRGRSSSGFISLIAVLFAVVTAGVSTIRPLAVATYAVESEPAIAAAQENDEAKDVVTLSGKIINNSRFAIPDATVQIGLYEHPKQEKLAANAKLKKSWQTTTDANGEYSFAVENFEAYDPKTEFYVHTVNADGYANLGRWCTLSKKNVPSKTQFPDVRLWEGRTVSGQIVGPNGEPIDGIANMVGAGKDVGKAWFPRSVPIQQDGRFEVVVPVEYQIGFVFYSKGLSPKRVTVEEGDSELGKIELSSGAIVKGNVTLNDGSTVSNVAIGLRASDGGNVRSVYQQISYGTLTNEDGNFEFPPVQGKFQLYLAKSIPNTNSIERTTTRGDQPPSIAGIELDLKNEGIEQVSLKQTATATVSGVIRWADQRPCEDVGVSVEGDLIDRLETKTDADGRYSIEIPAPMPGVHILVIGKTDAEGVFHKATGLYDDREHGQIVGLDLVEADVTEVNYEVREYRATPPRTKTRKHFDELIGEKHKADKAYREALKAADGPAAKQMIYMELDPRNVMAGKYLKFEEEHRGENDVFLGIEEVMRGAQSVGDPSTKIAAAREEMVDRLIDHYLGHKKLYRVFDLLENGPLVTQKDRLFKKAYQESPHREVQAAALAARINLASRTLREIKLLPELELLAQSHLVMARKPGFDPMNRRDTQRIEKLKKLDADELKQDANRWIESLTKKYSDVEDPDPRRSWTYKQLGEFLRTRINEIEIGKPVPELTATDVDGNKFQLSALKGKVVILTFAYSSTGTVGIDRAQIQKAYGDQGVEIVSVVSFLDSQKEEFLAQLKSEKPFGTFIPDDMYAGEIRAAWGGGGHGIFVIDRAGVLVHCGQMTLNLAKKIEKTVKKSSY